jgi:hypothetical protein
MCFGNCPISRFSSPASATGASPGGTVSFSGPLTITDTTQVPNTVVCTLNLIGTISASNATISLTQANIGSGCDNGAQLYYETNISLGTASTWTTGTPSGPTAGFYYYTLSGFGITSESLFGPFSSWSCSGSISSVKWDGTNYTLTIPSTALAGTSGHTCHVSGTLYMSPFQNLH